MWFGCTGGLKGVAARGLAMLSWGLLPEWANSSKHRRHPIARAETADQLHGFRYSFPTRRCLIPATGFYEWLPDGRRPFDFHMKDRSPFAFAALWAAWGEGREKVLACCLLTTPPNPMVARVHDRMPVILPLEAYADWLASDTPAERMMKLLGPYPAARMEGFEVGPYVS